MLEGGTKFYEYCAQMRQIPNWFVTSSEVQGVVTFPSSKSFEITPTKGNRVKSAFITCTQNLSTSFPIIENDINELQRETILTLLARGNSKPIINMGNKIYTFDSNSRTCYRYTDSNGAWWLLEFFRPSRVATRVYYWTTQYNANNTGQVELRSNDHTTHKDLTISGVNFSDLVQAALTPFIIREMKLHTVPTMSVRVETEEIQDGRM